MKYKDSNGQWQTIKFKNYGIEQTPIGSMIYYPSQSIPNGYLVCDGSEVKISDYQELFNVIGYIGGDDVLEGYFRLPDMRGTSAAGYYEGLDSSNPLAGNFGDQVGSPTHQLTIDEMPNHDHAIDWPNDGGPYAAELYQVMYSDVKNTWGAVMTTTQGTGGNQPHSIVQPTKLYHWLIKAKNIVTLGGYTEDFIVDGSLSVKNLQIENLIEIPDCNDTSLPTGIYYCSGDALNAPHASAWFLHVMNRVFPDGDHVITQVAYRYRDDEIQMRQYNSISPAGWKAWSVINSDSGWTTATLTSSFKPYSDDSYNIPEYRKIDKMVEIRGCIAPAATIASGGSAVIFTLPTGYRPHKEIYVICQGTGRAIWLLTIHPDNGNVAFSRYGKGDYTEASTSVWLPFHTTFSVD